MDGNRPSPARPCSAARSCADSNRAWGTQGTPQAEKCAFSNARCWQVATASAAGATGRRAANQRSACAGTFSNSVVTASQMRAISASAASSV